MTAFTLKKVLISDDIDEKCIEILERNGVEVSKQTKLSKDGLVQEIKKNYDGLIVRSATKVTAEVIEAAPHLKIIGRAGTGVDNIDCVAATKHGVIVMNTPGGNTTSAAELTCAMIMALSRQLPQAHESMRQGRWDRKKFMGNEVFGKTLAIIGLGRIGKEVATRMQSFGMRTIGFDPIIPAEVSATFNTQWLSLEEIWPQADYITVHTPLIAQTRNLISMDVLAHRCKKGVKLVNVARGGIIDEDAIVPAIEKGYCGGAALDVFVEEPPKNTTLTQHPQVICVPHLGANTEEAQTRVAEEIAQQFVDLSREGRLVGAVNAHALGCALNASQKPWVNCGEALGRLVAGVVGTIDENTFVSVHTQGPALESAGSYLVSAVMTGLLKPAATVNLNLVNAPALAEQLRIKSKLTHAHACGESHVTLMLEVNNGVVCSVTGQTDGVNVYLTAFNNKRFVQPVTLSGNVLLFEAHSSPKLVPDVFSTLAEVKVTPYSFSSTVHGSGDQTSWYVVHLPAALPSVTVLKNHVTKAYQIAY